VWSFPAPNEEDFRGRGKGFQVGNVFRFKSKNFENLKNYFAVF